MLKETKRTLALVLALLMMFGTFSSSLGTAAYADEPETEEEQVLLEYPEVRHHVPVQSVSRQDEPEKKNAAESGLKEPAREKAPVQTEEAGGDHSETHAQSAAGQAAETNEMKENQE